MKRQSPWSNQKTLFIAVHLFKRFVEIRVEIIPCLVTTLV